MTTYVFFNKNTGQIVHRHEEAALYGEPFRLSTEELMAMDLRLTPEDQLEPEDLDVLEVDREHHLLRRSLSLDGGKELYVDIQKQVLSEREREQS